MHNKNNDWDFANFPEMSYEMCEFCINNQPHSPKQHERSWKKAQRQEYKRENELYENAKRTYEYDRDF